MRKTNRIIPVICGPCKQSSRGASIVLLAQEGKLALDDEERKNISDAAADLLGCADAGAIFPGKRADLLAVAGDTAAEITALKEGRDRGAVWGIRGKQRRTRPDQTALVALGRPAACGRA